MKTLQLLLGRIKYEWNIPLQIGAAFSVAFGLFWIIGTLLRFDFEQEVDSLVVSGTYVSASDDLFSFVLGGFAFGVICLLIGAGLDCIRYARSSSVELHQEQWSFILYKNRGELYLEVLCGTVGVFEKRLLLKRKQREAFWLGGVSAITPIVDAVRYSPQDNPYTGQYVETPAP